MVKIAIQGHSTRGKEVIQILESLGGINRLNHKGHYTNYFYYVSSDDNTIAWTCIRPESNVYTLEEFEKEFPFKIGDKVIHFYTPNFIGIVVDIKFDDHIPYRVDIEGKICTCETTSLKPYKEMKEKRNITLTLDKAKEWYKKGGDLKQVALQAYSEEELTKVEIPKTWEEFCNNYMIDDNEAYFDSCCIVHSADGNCRNSLYDKSICPSKESAEAHLALIQLEQLRDCWRQGWKPTWDSSIKWCIRLWDNTFDIESTVSNSRFLTFPTKEMAEEFLECFRNLIEKAGDLI